MDQSEVWMYILFRIRRRDEQFREELYEKLAGSLGIQGRIKKGDSEKFHSPRFSNSRGDGEVFDFERSWGKTKSESLDGSLTKLRTGKVLSAQN